MGEPAAHETLRAGEEQFEAELSTRVYHYEERIAELEAERSQLLDLFRPVVERYGAHWRKDSDYYAAAAALGIEES